MLARSSIVLLLLHSLSLGGCDSIEKLVNATIPPVSADEHRATALATATSALSSMQTPNLALSLRLPDVVTVLEAHEWRKKMGIAQLSLRGDRQILFADVSVDKQFSELDFPGADQKTKDFIAQSKPAIKGSISLGLGLTSATAQPQNGNLVIDLRLLPLFRNIKIDKVHLTEKVDAAIAAQYLADILNRFADNVSGVLSRADFTKVTVPAAILDPVDPSRSIAFKSADGITANVTIKAQPVTSPVYLRSLVSLIDTESILVLAELTENSVPKATESVPTASPDFAKLKTEFLAKAQAAFENIEIGKENVIAVTRSLVALLTNSAMKDAQACIGVDAFLARQSFSEKVEIPDETTIDCTPTRNCTPTSDCTQTEDCAQTEACDQPHDTSDCRRCVARVCVNDPVCETAKAARNAGYAAAKAACEARKSSNKLACEARKEGRRVDCERLKATERGQCELEKTGEKDLCELKKEGLKRASRLGNVANIDGTVGGAAKIAVCIRKFELSPSLDRLDASFDVQGQGSADFSVKYVPLDIAGYLVCQAQWTEGTNIAITLPPSTVEISSRLSIDSVRDGALIKAEVKTSALTVQMRPGPRDILLKSYNMRLACPAMNGFLLPFDIDVVKAIPPLNGDIKLPGQERSFEVRVPPITFDIAGGALEASVGYSANAKALALTGKLYLKAAK